MERGAGGELQFLEDFELATSNPRVLELLDPKGLVRAVASGTADLIVSSAPRASRWHWPVPAMGARYRFFELADSREGGPFDSADCPFYCQAVTPPRMIAGSITGADSSDFA